MEILPHSLNDQMMPLISSDEYVHQLHQIQQIKQSEQLFNLFNQKKQQLCNLIENVDCSDLTDDRNLINLLNISKNTHMGQISPLAQNIALLSYGLTENKSSNDDKTNELNEILRYIMLRDKPFTINDIPIMTKTLLSFDPKCKYSIKKYTDQKIINISSQLCKLSCRLNLYGNLLFVNFSYTTTSHPQSTNSSDCVYKFSQYYIGDLCYLSLSNDTTLIKIEFFGNIILSVECKFVNDDNLTTHPLGINFINHLCLKKIFGKLPNNIYDFILNSKLKQLKYKHCISLNYKHNLLNDDEHAEFFIHFQKSDPYGVYYKNFINGTDVNTVNTVINYNFKQNEFTIKYPDVKILSSNDMYYYTLTIQHTTIYFNLKYLIDIDTIDSIKNNLSRFDFKFSNDENLKHILNLESDIISVKIKKNNPIYTCRCRKQIFYDNCKIIFDGIYDEENNLSKILVDNTNDYNNNLNIILPYPFYDNENFKLEYISRNENIFTSLIKKDDKIFVERKKYNHFDGRLSMKHVSEMNNPESYMEIQQLKKDFRETTIYKNDGTPHIHVVHDESYFNVNHKSTYYINNYKIELEIKKESKLINAVQNDNIDTINTIHMLISKNNNTIYNTVFDAIYNLEKSNLNILLNNINKNDLECLNLDPSNFINEETILILFYVLIEDDNIKGYLLKKYSHKSSKLSKIRYEFEYKFNQHALSNIIITKCMIHGDDSDNDDNDMSLDGNNNDVINMTKIKYENGHEISNINIDENNKLDVKLSIDHNDIINGKFGYKAAKTIDNDLCLVTLLIPKEAKNAFDPKDDKYRTNMAQVINIKPINYVKNKINPVKENLSECKICYDNNDCYMAIPCKHRFCLTCWKKLISIQHNVTCPYCTQDIEQIAIIDKIPEYLINEENFTSLTEAYSCVYTDDFKYKLGEMITVDNFDSNLSKVCAPGIHYYLEIDKVFKWFEYLETEQLCTNVPWLFTTTTTTTTTTIVNDQSNNNKIVIKDDYFDDEHIDKNNDEKIEKNYNIDDV